MKIALVHDWLNGMRGGESVLEALIEVYPNADLFTLVYEPDALSPLIRSRPVNVSLLQRLPFGIKKYRQYLPLMPKLIEEFDLTGYELIISSSHCVAKGIRKPAGAKHISYVHAPMRYMWDRFDDYFGPGKASLPVRWVARSVRRYLQNWDRRVSQADRVDALAANSRFIARQIEQAYGRQSQVIYPFVDFERFSVQVRSPQDFYLIVSAFAPYKRIDLAIEAANRMNFKLKIVGSGQDEALLRRLAGPTVEFLGGVSRERIAELYATARAFLFPGVEDFGITPLEALASGTPVIAYGAGGALETVTENTGIFFREQSIDGLCDAIRRFETGSTIEVKACRDRAREFSKARFQREFKDWADRVIAAK